jgi:hypothetical protein
MWPASRKGRGERILLGCQQAAFDELSPVQVTRRLGLVLLPRSLAYTHQYAGGRRARATLNEPAASTQHASRGPMSHSLRWLALPAGVADFARYHDVAAGHLMCRRGRRSTQPAQCADDRLRGHQSDRPIVNNSGYVAGFRRRGRSRLMLVTAAPGHWRSFSLMVMWQPFVRLATRCDNRSCRCLSRSTPTLPI